MKKVLKTIFLCLVAIAGRAYSQQVVVQFGVPTYLPSSLPNCTTSPITRQQTATYSWTLYCVTNGNFTGISSGSVSGTGTGTCPGGTQVHYCSGAPSFSPQYQVGSPNVSIYVSITSVTGATSGECNPPSVTQGPIATTPTPACSCSSLGGPCKVSTDCCGNTYICKASVCAQPGGGSPIVLDTLNEEFHL